MRYIDHTGKKALERGESREIKLSRTATKIAEENGLGVLKTRLGAYWIIKDCGLGAYSDAFGTLAEVDRFFKTLDKHSATRY